ncbi:MAG TPA: glycosyltransferase [Pyrinomonadaceae bacterium]|jgi:glycosyltransferase involved in cell wall biosynthesis
MPRNVLQLVGSFNQGGSERQAAQLTRLLAESGRYRVRVACLSAEGVLRGEVERLGLGEIPEYPLTSFYDRRFVAQLRRFAAFLRAEKIDLVQTHDFYSNVFGMAGAALARVQARVASKRETGGMRTAAQRRVELLAFRLAHAVVANSEAVKQQLVGDGVPARKVAVVYNGLDPARVRTPAGFSRAEALAGLGLPADGGRRFVTLVANLRHAVKDHPTFLRAARRVREEVPEAAFVLAGEGQLEAPLRELASELGIADAVFFTGRCTQVGALLAASDVCVLSSTAEGFSNSILEYMAAGRPVVATEVGGAREAIVEGETGHLVPAGDEGRMAARIGGLLRDPARARAMGERGRGRVAQQFSCAAQLARTEALYERLLARAETGARRLMHADTVADGRNR